MKRCISHPAVRRVKHDHTTNRTPCNNGGNCQVHPIIDPFNGACQHLIRAIKAAHPKIRPPFILIHADHPNILPRRILDARVPGASRRPKNDIGSLVDKILCGFGSQFPIIERTRIHDQHVHIRVHILCAVPKTFRQPDHRRNLHPPDHRYGIALGHFPGQCADHKRGFIFGELQSNQVIRQFFHI